MMTVTECYRKLNVRKGAAMDEIKSSYRKLAFKYHPDLNKAPNAAERFREINEAYVIIKESLGTQQTETKAKSKKKPSQEKTYARPSQGAKAYERQKKTTQRPKDSTFRESTRSKSQRFYYKEEEVLKNLLNDPFARKVFEDIYSQVKKDNPDFNGPVGLKKRNLALKFGGKRINLDITGGIGDGIKGWIKGQMDYEQTVYFPIQALIPGRKIRISVEQKFSKGPRNIEVTLPPDFVVGRPIRLRGLGRRLGPIKGDLLLRILPKQ